jgi:hypothetical protein
MERLYDKICGLREQVNVLNREILKISHEHITNILGVSCIVSWVNDQDYDDNNYFTTQKDIVVVYFIDGKKYEMLFDNYCDLDDTEAWFENNKVSEEFPDLEFDDTKPEWASAITECYGKAFSIDELAQIANGVSWLIDTAVNDAQDTQNYGE